MEKSYGLDGHRQRHRHTGGWASKFHTKLFSKRDVFPFDIVRMPFLDSNIPNTLFCGRVAGEIISRLSNDAQHRIYQNCKSSVL